MWYLSVQSGSAPVKIEIFPKFQHLQRVDGRIGSGARPSLHQSVRSVAILVANTQQCRAPPLIRRQNHHKQDDTLALRYKNAPLWCLIIVVIISSSMYRAPVGPIPSKYIFIHCEPAVFHDEHTTKRRHTHSREQSRRERGVPVLFAAGTHRSGRSLLQQSVLYSSIYTYISTVDYFPQHDFSVILVLAAPAGVYPRSRTVQIKHQPTCATWSELHVHKHAADA